MTGRRRLPRKALRLLAHPRTQMAVKSALAATLSWFAAEAVAQGLQGLEEYVYYAPLGAVVTAHPTLLASLRTAWSSVLSVAVGAALGLFVLTVLEQGPVSLAAAVGGGVVLGSLPGLGSQRSWVPIVALFVLVIGGQGEPGDYALTYVGLIALGAVCGVVVNLLLPTLRRAAGEEALARLKTVLADQLAASADTLRKPPGSARQDWQQQLRDPVLEVGRTREAMQEVLDARRGNLRARFHAEDLQRLQQLQRSLERVSSLVDDLPELLLAAHPEDGSGPLDDDLAAVTADALDRLAELVRAYDTDLPVDDPRVEAAEEAVQRLTAAFGSRPDLQDSDVALLGAVVVSLRRSLAFVTPEPAE